MLWSTVVQGGTPRQAETTIEAKNPGRGPARRTAAGVSPADSRTGTAIGLAVTIVTMSASAHQTSIR